MRLSAVATNVAKRMGMNHLSQQAQAYEPQDPHYESYTDSRGRLKQRKRKLPGGLSKRDQRVLRSVRRRAHYLDKGFTVCGWRFGWTFLIGLIPGLGDVVDFLLGYNLVIRKAKKAELPPQLVSKMIFNLVVATCLGVIPLVGDICLATWKANSRNAALLEDFLIARSTAASTASTSTRPSDPASLRRDEEAQASSIIAASKIDHRTGERIGPPPAYLEEEEVTENTPLARASGSHAHAVQGTAGKKKKKWYGWGKDPQTV